jgi:hypothetical protein
MIVAPEIGRGEREGGDILERCGFDVREGFRLQCLSGARNPVYAENRPCRFRPLNGFP